MKNFRLIFVVLLTFLSLSAQSQIKTPDILYGDLFKQVQLQKVFSDGKTFVDMVPKAAPEVIINAYTTQKSKADFNLKTFVNSYFYLPSTPQTDYVSNIEKGVEEHINELWSVLERKPDSVITGSSLIALPESYIVPGGRFREVYYWDSYFTMLGLAESGKIDIIESMIKNFAFLIDTYGHIPNGNRVYYISRSQPPFFAMMVELLANAKNDQAIYQTYLPQLLKEHQYWTSGKKLIKINDTDFLSRYWDESDQPRQESYREDVETAKQSNRNIEEIYHHLRAGAESGWDFSSRWFADNKTIKTIETTNIIPVDLNALLYKLELVIAKAYLLSNNKTLQKDFENKANKRIALINKFCWNKKLNFYTDYNFKNQQQEQKIIAAGLMPLFVTKNNIELQKNIANIAKQTSIHLLRPGGIVTTTVNSGQQWDAPNGWAPLQFIAIKGFENYNQNELAKTIAERWIALNVKVFNKTGKLMEKYNVENINLEAGGGEYASQDGFGWTNGVLLKLMNIYQNDKQTLKQP